MKYALEILVFYNLNSNKLLENSMDLTQLLISKINSFFAENSNFYYNNQVYCYLFRFSIKFSILFHRNHLFLILIMKIT